ncbi:hypothetical protein [Chromobacterium sp. IIBBL 290-4]|uniref:hypothetical protein n=1 Tax=Chromobacterium sp. IIBBL 290-4 TaxID=2953890 RepID=UPI0020B82FA2|nr:hypothetical protein [Chromobacterium sp. IIBBL 290-4]UTH73110.1 hypothetical protein NKT35_16420 [Chromobacterium sp. IIBBL 290-4]
MRGMLWLAALLALGGCNYVNSVTGLTKDADKAIGASCRQTGRSLEECFQRNSDSDKAAIYAGWREMNEYMVKNKLDTMAPIQEKHPASSGMADAPTDKSSEAKPMNAKSAMTGQADASQPKPLSSEEADREAKTDPQVEAVLSAMRSGGNGSGNSGKPAASKGEPDQNRLLNIINDLNKKNPPQPPG